VTKRLICQCELITCTNVFTTQKRSKKDTQKRKNMAKIKIEKKRFKSTLAVFLKLRRGLSEMNGCETVQRLYYSDP